MHPFIDVDFNACFSPSWQGPLPPSATRLRWSCSLFVGPPRWRGTEVCEPDECGAMFDTLEDAEDLRESSASARCPLCGGELTEGLDEPEVIMETGKSEEA